MKTKSETAVIAKITVTIAGQSFEMTVDEAKKLKAQLEAAIPEMKWPVIPYTPPVYIERPVFVPMPHYRQVFETPLRNPYEVTCNGTGTTATKMEMLLR